MDSDRPNRDFIGSAEQNQNQNKSRRTRTEPYSTKAPAF